MSIKLLPRERYLRTARPSRGNRGGPARRGSRCYELGKLLSDVPACRAIGSITGEDRSVGDIRAHRDLRSVPGAADLFEIEGCGKVPLNIDLRFQIGDLLLRSGNGVNICRQLGTASLRVATTSFAPNRAAAWPHQLSLRSCPRVR